MTVNDRKSPGIDSRMVVCYGRTTVGAGSFQNAGFHERRWVMQHNKLKATLGRVAASALIGVMATTGMSVLNCP
jgi:hypothetical protein